MLWLALHVDLFEPMQSVGLVLLHAAIKALQIVVVKHRKILMEQRL
jgi:hypothetical protein